MQRDWSVWQRTWLTWAETDCFKRRIDKALDAIRDAENTGRELYVGVSGGKDSIALAWLVAEAGADFRWAHARTPMETPGMFAAADAMAVRCDRELDIIDPDLGKPFWEWLRTLPPIGSNPFREPYAQEVRDRCSAGALLYWYSHAYGFSGYLTGMRTEESRGRRLNRKVRGIAYQRTDHMYICNPISDWTARDVWAAIVSNDLPTCPHYRLTLEKLGMSPESPASRVDFVVAPEGATAFPILYTTSVLYPSLFRQICEARPECRKEARL